MKIKKVNENVEKDVSKIFYFLNDLSLNKDPIKAITFLKSLNLTNEQYVKLEEIISDYASERYIDGRQDGIDAMTNY